MRIKNNATRKAVKTIISVSFFQPLSTEKWEASQTQANYVITINHAKIYVMFIVEYHQRNARSNAR